VKIDDARCFMSHIMQRTSKNCVKSSSQRHKDGDQVDSCGQATKPLPAHSTPAPLTIGASTSAKGQRLAETLAASHSAINAPSGGARTNNQHYPAPTATI
jgi:hypothetical protein